MSRSLFLLSALIAGAACSKSSQESKASSSSGAPQAACVERDTCVEYRELPLTEVQKFCAGAGQTARAGGCPTEEVLGTCDTPALHNKMFWYERGLASLHQSRADAVVTMRKQCTDTSGIWAP